MRSFARVMAASFTEPNKATIGFRLCSFRSPDQMQYACKEALEKDGHDSDEYDDIPFPHTKMAQAYLRGERERRSSQLGNPSMYDDIYALSLLWMVKYSASLCDENPMVPRSISTSLMIKALNNDPPQFQPQILGFSSWEELVASIDEGRNGYITISEISVFWGELGVRSAYMKNRKPHQVHSAMTLLLELINSMHTVSEERLLMDPENVRRTCVLNTKYVDTMDFDLEPGDKTYLYELGKRDALRFLKKRAKEIPCLAMQLPHMII